MEMMENRSKRKRECDLTNDEFDRISYLPVDLISNLPDTILRHIICCLPTEEAFRTAFLFKRWKTLCSPLPVLVLDFHHFSKTFNNLSTDDKRKRFIEFVESMIELHQGHSLEELRLALDISIFGRNKFPTLKWVKFAMKSYCLTLDLDFSGGEKEGRNNEKPYVLPVPYKGGDPVTVMKLNSCKFAPFNYQGYTCLKILVMTACKIKKCSMSEMLYGCPVLQELHVIECIVSSDDVFEFYVHYSKLKCLVLDSCYGTEGYISSILIDYPSLSKFKYVGEMLENFKVRNLENLIEAEICFQNGDISHEHHRMLLDVLVNMSHVTTLKLCRRSLKVLSTGNGLEGVLQLSLDNLKHVTVSTCLGDFEHKGLAYLLSSSPHLETLSVDLSTQSFESFIFWEAQSAPFACLHLKEVKIKSFHGLHNEMEFIEYILKHASALEKMIIYMAVIEESSCDSVKLDDNERQQLRLSQADREVVILDIFSHKFFSWCSDSSVMKLLKCLFPL